MLTLYIELHEMRKIYLMLSSEVGTHRQEILCLGFVAEHFCNICQSSKTIASPQLSGVRSNPS